MTETNKESAGTTAKSRDRGRRKSGRSMFGPIVLITIGVFLLLANLDLLPELNWSSLLRVWPLALIFIGLNVIVRQTGRPLGTILSAFVGLLAVAVFSYVLLFGSETPLIGERLKAPSGAQSVEHLTYPAADVGQAEIYVNFSAPGGQVFALVDSGDLIDAQVTSEHEIIFESEVAAGQAIIRLESAGAGDWAFWSNPARWFDEDEANPWQVGLSPRVSSSLEFDLGSGKTDLELESLALQALSIDGGSGAAELSLPAGDYDMFYKVGSGPVVIALPMAGIHDFEIDGGSGELTILVPTGAAVQLTTEGGSGELDLSAGIFRAAGQTESGEERWRTADYGNSGDRIDLYIDVGSGSVTFEEA